MSEKDTQSATIPGEPPPLSPEMNEMLRHAETSRVSFMRDYRNRENLFVGVMIFSALVGGLGFAWLFLMEGALFRGLLVLIAASIPAVLVGMWKKAPLDAYKKHYKDFVLPNIAKALGGLRYMPNRGIPEKVLSSTKIMPRFSRYHAEDCFKGKHKNTTIIFSEAKLYGDNTDPIFDGLFVLLELPKKIHNGVSILTSDMKLASKVSKKLKAIDLSDNAFALDLRAYSNDLGNAQLLSDKRLIKEIDEMIKLFDNAPSSLSFFGGRYVFFMIPYEVDMFEACDIRFPITTTSSIRRCAHEVTQIQSIIDIFDMLDSDTVETD